MTPPTIDPDTPSEGERLIFEQFAADDSRPDWTVLHSLDIARHRRQLAGEVDFLVIAPGLGVLVLEVKGCHRLKRKHGLWYYGGGTEGRSRSPFRQASEAMHSLRERLTKRESSLSGVLFWSAVCFPYVDFTDQSEEWTPWQVIDRSRLAQRPLAECVESVLRQARDRAAELRLAWFDPAAGEPAREQADRILGALRGDFEFFDSPKVRARRAEEEIRRYTEEQFRALDQMRRTPRVVFDGPAGTGKTLLALEAARRGHAAGRSVLFLCFNRPLALWLQDQAAELLAAGRTPAMTVRTLHQYMVDVAGPSVRGSPADGETYWDEALPQAATERLLENWERLERTERDGLPSSSLGPTLGIYDELIVDEAQDVVRDCFLDVLDLSVRGGLSEGTWRMFGDFAWQTIYDDTVSLDGFCEGRGANCPQIPLDENCRNTPRVAALACSAGDVAPGYSRVLRPDDGIDPEVRYYADAAGQALLLQSVLQELYDEQFTGPQVAVLSTKSDERAVAPRLPDQSWRDRLQPLIENQDFATVVNTRTGRTHYSSIHRFKGLEANAVVVTDVERLDSARERSLVYVGATRAKHRLVVLAHESLRGRLA